MKNETLPTIAITTGDPAGIGPEVVLKALTDQELLNIARWVVIGDAAIFDMIGERIGLKPPNGIVQDRGQIAAHWSGYKAGQVCLLDLRQLEPTQFTIGKLSAACGRAALEYVRTATQLCLDGQVDAMVTAPLNKEAVTLTGQSFTATRNLSLTCPGRQSHGCCLSTTISGSSMFPPTVHYGTPVS